MAGGCIYSQVTPSVRDGSSFCTVGGSGDVSAAFTYPSVEHLVPEAAVELLGVGLC